MNPEYDLAWQLVQNTGCNVFLTGKAGTGKTTFLKHLVANTHKRNVVLAPTGIAAINAHGSTIHSFFQLPFGPYIPGTDFRANERNFKFSQQKRRLISSLDLLIIDEISMVRADLLDSIDAVLRRFRDRTRPFGGVQLLLIGDLQQLAPVAKPEEWQILQPYYETQYFFSSNALRETGYVAVELKTVYRQKDQEFLDLLNKIRNNEADERVLTQLNARYIPNFNPNTESGYIRLTTHNWQADQINQRELDALQTKEQTYKAEIWKEYPELSFPTAQHLQLKEGAQVMFVKNDSSLSKQYFNGMIATVIELKEHSIKVKPQDSDNIITVTQEQWENTRYKLNEATKEIEEELIGTFTQFPLKAAWAITVHKSQGLTFERAIIDVQYAFSHGQTYVALSRCRSLEGLVLSSPIPRPAIITDDQIVSYTQSIEKQVPTIDDVNRMQRDYYLSLAVDLFTFHKLSGCIDAYIRHIDEWFSQKYPEQVATWKLKRTEFSENIERVSVNFSLQYQKIIASSANYSEDDHLQSRFKKGATWFLEHLKEIETLLDNTHIASRNKAIEERIVTLNEELKEQLRVKMQLLSFVIDNGFYVSAYLKKRAWIQLHSSESTAKTEKKSKTKKATTTVRKKSTPKENTRLYNTKDSEEDFPDLTHTDLPY